MASRPSRPEMIVYISRDYNATESHETEIHVG